MRSRSVPLLPELLVGLLDLLVVTRRGAALAELDDDLLEFAGELEAASVVVSLGFGVERLKQRGVLGLGLHVRGTARGRLELRARVRGVMDGFEPLDRDTRVDRRRLDTPRRARADEACPICGTTPIDARDYAYLLGLRPRGVVDAAELQAHLRGKGRRCRQARRHRRNQGMNPSGVCDTL